jgi:cytochrome b6-f complex iron-sulfur subunit
VTVSTGTYLVARTAQSTVTTVTAVCTHEGCAVSGFAGSVYVCPCHGSQFNTSGAVVQGPATSPLRQFPTTFAGNVVTISV